MNCPLDGAALAKQRYEGLEIDRCPDCGGTWLDRGELEAIQEVRPAHTDVVQPDEVGMAFEMARQEAEPLHDCPVCAEKMERREYGYASQVLVDVCPKHGTWLDRGELEALERFYEREKQDADTEWSLVAALQTFLLGR